jgi:nucleotide-binding universal stress UspA family protein
VKILLATDGTKHSESAVEKLKSFDSKQISEIKIVSIVDMAIPIALNTYEGIAPTTLEIENNARENAHKILAETAAELESSFPNSIITTEVLLGSADSKIVESAEEIKADIIVVGSHGYNRWERLLLGSVSDSVVRHSHCSVLVVRS